MNSIIGIDPGKGGGIAIVYFGERYKKWVAHKCPKTIKEMVILVKMFKHSSPNAKCFMEFVTPQKWQKHFGELPKIKKDRKNKLKEIASKKSKLKATLNTSDAICIAVYGYENTN